VFYFPLNYEKVIKALKSNNVTYVCAVLQALRWRITQTRGAELRREILIAYQTNDVLELSELQPENQNCLCYHLLLSSKNRKKEYITRFINALASDYQGRSYLLNNDYLLEILIKVLRIEIGDTVIRRNTLGALQKLSLRR